MKLKDDIITEEIKNCPVYRMMELFQGKWTVWVLFELNKNKTMRFGELKKAIPNISNTMLTSTLKDLEERDLIERIQFNEIPPRVEYSPTDKARDLHIVFDAMYEWASKNM